MSTVDSTMDRTKEATTVTDRPLIKTEVRATSPEAATTPAKTAIKVENVNLSYGDNHVLHDISLDIAERAATAFIGPSGCGKSTLLRCLNRMNDLIDGVKVTGVMEVNGADLYAAVHGRHRGAPAHRDGVPEVEPVPQVDL